MPSFNIFRQETSFGFSLAWPKLLQKDVANRISSNNLRAPFLQKLRFIHGKIHRKIIQDVTIGMGFSFAVVIAATVIAADASETLPNIQKVFLPQRLYMGSTWIMKVQPIDDVAWIWHPESAPVLTLPHADVFAVGWREPVLLHFRREFDAGISPIRINVSADERFELFLPKFIFAEPAALALTHRLLSQFI